MATPTEEARHEEERSIQAVLSTREGRLFTRLVLGFLEWNEDIYTSDPTLLTARVGRQSAGNAFYHKLDELQPELLARVFIEERERRDLRRRVKDGGRSDEG